MSVSDISVPSAVVMYGADGSRVVYYRVECGGSVSYHRYSELRRWALHDLRGVSCSTAKRCPALAGGRAAMPQRVLGGPWGPAGIAARREGLQAWLRGLRAGQCARHRRCIDDLLLAATSSCCAAGRVLPLGTEQAARRAELFGMDRTVHSVPAPPGLGCYAGLDVQVGERCFFAVAGGTLRIVLEAPWSPAPRDPEVTAATAAEYAALFARHFTPRAVAKQVCGAVDAAGAATVAVAAGRGARARGEVEGAERGGRAAVIIDEERRCDGLAAAARSLRAQAEKAWELAQLQRREAEAKATLSRIDEESRGVDARVRQIGRAMRDAHGEIEEMKGKIRVFVRARPGAAGEESGDTLAFPGGEERCVRLREPRGAQRGAAVVESDYAFDRAFPPATTQAEVFAEAQGMCRTALDGHNCCVFAYGQTGSGKTHSLVGTEADPGIARRSMRRFFDLAAEHAGTHPGQRVEVECSMVELYIDTFYDLLARGAGPRAGGPQRSPPKSRSRRSDEQEPAAARATPPKARPGSAAPAAAPVAVKMRQGEMEGLVWTATPTYDDLVAAFTRGSTARTTRATAMNDQSSRSHLIFTVRVRTVDAAGKELRAGQLALVDLAGSERVKKSEVTGDGLKEAVAINKSLSALGNVIEALGKGCGHVPYRDHELTMAMEPFLTGRAKMLLLVAVSPAKASVEESRGSLTFAQRTKKVQLVSPAQLQENQARIEAKDKELAALSETLSESTRSAMDLPKRKAECEQLLASCSRASASMRAELMEIQRHNPAVCGSFRG